jgi:hypothetical protein
VSALVATVAACGQPSWRDPATSKGSAAPAPEVRAVIHSGTAASPKHPAKFTTTDPLPPPPDWAADLVGKAMTDAFKPTGACIGNTDGVLTRYAGDVPGLVINGWSWDPAQKAPIAHVILVNANALIAGAGDAGMTRLDVPRARPDVTSDRSGWRAMTPQTAGRLDVYGVLADGKTVCRLGSIDL